MVRLLAFALNADERLEFGRGLSSEDEPDLVKRDLTGAIELWIDVGLPDERAVRKAAGRAREVKVYVYGGRSAALWWARNEEALARLRNVSVIEIADSVADTVTAIAERNMRLTAPSRRVAAERRNVALRILNAERLKLPPEKPPTLQVARRDRTALQMAPALRAAGPRFPIAAEEEQREKSTAALTCDAALHHVMTSDPMAATSTTRPPPRVPTAVPNCITARAAAIAKSPGPGRNEMSTPAATPHAPACSTPIAQKASQSRAQ